MTNNQLAKESDEPPDPNAGVIWQVGNPWRDLTAELIATEGPLTVVTAHLTVHILHLCDRWQLRIPSPLSQQLRGDDERSELVEIVSATPCGIHTTGSHADSWRKTTPLFTVLGPNALGSDLARALRWQDADPIDERAWLRGHPTEPCRALHCARTIGREGG